MPIALRQPNFAVVLGLAWLVTAGWLWLQFAPGVGAAFSDPDDAMRLVELRAYLAGQSWFDLNEARVDPPFGYVTHWSRLVDAGLAGVFLAAKAVAGPDAAERLTLSAWPLLWLLPAMASVALIAWRMGGREAATIALILAVFGLPAFQHFKPGRIDHHNVQIVLALAVVAAADWADRARPAAVAVGLLSALAFAVGLESAPWVALAGAAIALHYVADENGAPALMWYGFSLAVGVAAAYDTGVAPANWAQRACDAIAINSAFPAMFAGLALGIVGRWFSAPGVAMRAVQIGAIAAVAVIVAIILERRCLGGPFALIDPAVRPIWLAQVREMDPLTTLWRDAPVMGAWVSTFPAMAVLAATCLLRTPLRRDYGFLVAAAALIVAAAMTVMAVKTYSYAMWFGMPLAAVAAAHLFARLRKPVRLMAATVLTPVAISASAITLAQATGSDVLAPAVSRAACFKADSYAALAQLPVGTIAADVDYGPLILAFTPHRVLAAPYHRLSHGIIAAHRAFARPPDDARKVLAEAKVDYVVLCGGARVTGLTGDALTTGLWATLQRGDVPVWLEVVPQAADQAFTAYRVR